MVKSVAFLAILLAIDLLSSVRAESAPSIRLTDVTNQVNISFRHDDGSCGNYYILEPMSCGLVLFDYDGDGDVDVYFLNGKRLCPGEENEIRRNSLYRNDGNWTFTDVTEQAGVGDTAHGLGATAGDYDNDGDLDLYLNNYGPNVLYRNNGDGTFTDVTHAAGVSNGNRVGAGTCFVDADSDGDLDLYVANYIQFSLDKHIPRTKRGHPIVGAPRDYSPDSDTLFRNNGDGTFADVSEAAGIAKHAAPGMGMVCADYDNDGDTDVFVANDGYENYLFQNDGRGHFQEVGLISGFAYDGLGHMHSSMGVDCSDMNNDGLLDFHVTSFQEELATLYRNSPGGFLEDVTSASGAGQGTRAPVTWGNAFVDFDNDGDRDLFIAAGHLYDTVHLFDKTMTYELPNLLFENLGAGKFRNISNRGGNGMLVRFSTRGAAFDDLDNDGDIDGVLLNSREKPTFLRNDSPNTNHWIKIRLQGRTTNRDGVGSKVEIVSGGTTQVDEVHSGRGYQSHFGSTLHFGLGASATIDRLTVYWHGGGTSVYRNVRADRSIRIRQPADSSLRTKPRPQTTPRIGQ